MTNTWCLLPHSNLKHWLAFSAPLHLQALSAGAELPSLQAQVAAFVDKYAASAAGPTKWERLSRFLSDAWPGAVSALLGREQAKAQQAVDALKTQVHDRLTP